ncbi:hypothetical protein L9F63_005949 [Diploptera punctata]|uniref:Protein takeout n=1 Tax=Diploptera punctata TaxID=6984 RepID=A0AAD7ZCG7_DIPPU|nr:hypothetical protein L9F63_005949 [Diploptera punctata]
MQRIIVLAAFTSCWLFAQPLKLPEYIKPCRRYAPDVQECILKTVRATIPHVVNGDPKYRVPPLDPVLIDRLEINQGSGSVGMSIIAHDAFLRGVRNVDVLNVTHNFEKRVVDFDWFFPEVRIDCIYNVTGRALLLPIEGYGNGTIILGKVRAHYTYHWDTTKKKDAKDYYLINSAKLTFDLPEKMSINLENLFHGNKLLGDNMNRFMNENWKEIIKDVGPGMADALGEYIRQVLNNIYSLVPVENSFIFDKV